MAPLGRAAFARLLAGLSRPAFCRFVADLWRARGVEVTVEGGKRPRLTVTADDGTERVLGVHHAPGPLRRAGAAVGLPIDTARTLESITPTDDDPVDAVVTSARVTASDAAFDVIDADDLRGFALYAIPREQAETVFETYFGRTPYTRENDARLPGLGASTLTLGLVGVLLLIAGASGVLLAVDAGGGTLTPFDETPTPEPTPTPAPTAIPTEPDPDGTSLEHVTVAPNASRSEYPPGVGPSGVLDATEMARYHTLDLLEGPYEWTITYREVVNGTTRGYLRETVVVANRSVYRVDVERNGTLRSPTFLVADNSSYADGEAVYTRIATDDGVTYERRPFVTMVGQLDPPFVRPRRLIQWYLSVSESSVIGTFESGEGTIFLIRGSGDDWPRTTNVSVRAVVHEDGFVHYLERHHQPPDFDARVVVTMGTIKVTDAALATPSWITANDSPANRTTATTEFNESGENTELIAGARIIPSRNAPNI